MAKSILFIALITIVHTFIEIRSLNIAYFVPSVTVEKAKSKMGIKTLIRVKKYESALTVKCCLAES